jgi:hypothetical protein
MLPVRTVFGEDLAADGTIALAASKLGDPHRVAWWSPDLRP